MKNNETSFRHSRAPRTVHPLTHKKSTTGPEFRDNSELSAGALRRKLAAEERRRLRKKRRRERREKKPTSETD